MVNVLRVNATFTPLSTSHLYLQHPRSYFIPFFVAVAMDKTTPPASSPSSANLRAVFETSLKRYEKKTKKSLLTLPLMAQLQDCNSPADTLTILRSRAANFEQTMDADDKFIRWLVPIVNILSASSSVINAGVGMVNPIQIIFLRSSLLDSIFRRSHLRMSFSLAPISSFR